MFSGEDDGIESDGEHATRAHPDALDATSGTPVAEGCVPTADDGQLRAWIARIVERDESALAALYDAVVGRVHGLALRIVRQHHLAEEVTEDVFWQVWRQAPRFDTERGTAMAWLMTIARSRALDALRRQASPEVCDDDALEAAAAEEGGSNPFDLLSAVDDRNRLHAALADVDALPRQLLALAFFRGLTHDEIAQHTGLPLGTVKSQLRRTLLALRETLETSTAQGTSPS